jgi:Carboxypeptidase regulatory-like domain
LTRYSLSFLKFAISAATILTFIFLISVAARAQVITGSIRGVVKDPSGSAVAGVEVTAKHATTGDVRKTISDGEGSYAFSSLPIGNYEITATARGFKKALIKEVELHISDHLGLDIKLDIGEAAEEVTIVGNGLQLNTETSEQSGLISGEQIQELQLNGRSFMSLLELLPGIASNMPDRADPNTNPDLYVNGARSTASSFNIDGGNNSDVIVGSSSLNTFTSIDTIAEVKVITSTFAAEYGRSGASQVNVVTKGGGRQFHGSAYEFFRNDALDAKDYLTHQTLPLKLNNFGYNFGGPVLLPGGYNRGRDKTFFFFTQEFNRISSRAGAVNTRVPTDAERRGDFRALGAGSDRIFGTPDDPVIDPRTRSGFPNGIIPQDRMDPNALKLINLYPSPNTLIPGTNLNFTSAHPTKQRWREELIRIDHTFTDKIKIFGRYAQDAASYLNPYGGTTASAIDSPIPGISTTRATRPGKNLVVNLTSILSPALLNETSFTYAGREITRKPVLDFTDRTTMGLTIPELFPENDGNLIPVITLNSGYATLSISRHYLKKLFNLEFTDNLTWTKGKHIFKFGGYYTYGGNRENSSAATNGNFSFTTGSPPGFSRNAVANMLLGLPNTYAEAERMVVAHTRFAAFEGFAQDDFKATPNFTINIGLRYAAYFNPWDVDNVATNFMPSAWAPAKAPQVSSSNGRITIGTGDLMNGIIIAGNNSPYGRKVTKDNTDLWGPRIGFAWVPFGAQKWVVRAGYGIYYSRPLIGTFINSSFDNVPHSRSVTINTPSMANPGGGTEGLSSPNLTALDMNMKAATINQWSLGIQHELRNSTILNVSYVGSSGSHLMRPLNINTPARNPALVTNANPLNSMRPYLGWGNITQRQSSASSNYHSLQAKFDQRLKKTLNLGVAYTYSKSIDNSSSERNATDVPPNGLDARMERGPSDFDRTHIFTTNFIWYLPKLVGGGFAGGLLNGWQFSGIGRLWSGTPFDVVMNDDVAGVGPVQNQRPDIIADTKGKGTADQYFNIDAFARPRTGIFGSMGRNSMRGQNVNKWDLALYKNFTLKEGVKLQFRSEAFNVFNHPVFTSFVTTINTNTTRVNPTLDNFGKVTATRDTRVLQFALKLNF